MTSRGHRRPTVWTYRTYRIDLERQFGSVAFDSQSLYADLKSRYNPAQDIS